jgi:hypothetical protein
VRIEAELVRDPMDKIAREDPVQRCSRGEGAV